MVLCMDSKPSIIKDLDDFSHNAILYKTPKKAPKIKIESSKFVPNTTSTNKKG